MVKAASAIWLLAIAVVFGAFAKYHSTAGAGANAPSTLPIHTMCEQPDCKDYHLLFFVHPGCPCTKASWYELERILPPISTRTHVTAIVVEYLNSIPAEDQTDVVKLIGASKNIDVVFLPENAVRNEFGVTTSGQCLLYNTSDILVFEGGVTPSRNHTGPNKGIEKIMSIAGPAGHQHLKPQLQTTQRTKVFGCGL